MKVIANLIYIILKCVLLFVVLFVVIGILPNYIYKLILKSNKLDTTNDMDFYAKNYKKYLKNIKAFNDKDRINLLQECKLNKFMEKIGEIYRQRKEENLIISDELELKDIINNLKNRNFTSVPFICLMLTINVSVWIAILNTDKFKKEVTPDLYILILAVIGIVTIIGIGLEIFLYDFNNKKTARKISLYELCLEILLKVKNEEFDDKKSSKKNEICEGNPIPRDKKFSQLYKFSELNQWWGINKFFNFLKSIWKWILKFIRAIKYKIINIIDHMKLEDKLAVFIFLTFTAIVIYIDPK